MTEVATSPKTPLWMRIVLFTSLAINLLIIGAVAGFFLTGGPDKRDARTDRDVGSVFARALEPADRRALRRDFLRGLAEQGREPGAIVTDMRETLGVLRTSPFDADAFNTVMARQSERRNTRDDIGRIALAARISDMSDEERAAYADRVESGLRDLSQRLRRRE